MIVSLYRKFEGSEENTYLNFRKTPPEILQEKGLVLYYISEKAKGDVKTRKMAAKLLSWSKNFNIELREVIFGCCVTNTYDDDTMSPDVGMKIK